MVERQVMNVGLTFILLLSVHSTEPKKSPQLCPIGFELAYSRIKGEQNICYSLKKEPEKFTGKFENCAGNLFTQQLYNSLIVPDKPEVKLWTDYKSLYPGGPFVDWSYTESTGNILETTYEVNRDSSLRPDEELCVAVDPVNNFTAAKCDELHYRFCFLNVYPESKDDMDDDGCDELSDGWRFWSPLPTCLAPVTVGGKGSGRGVTWSHSQTLCEKRGGALLSRGWRYSNCPAFSTSTLSDTYSMFPLGVVLTTEHTLLRYEAGNYTSEIPSAEWHFDGSEITNDTSLGAVSDGFWSLVNSSHVFNNVICEKPIELKHVNLTVIVNSEDLIIVTVSDTSLRKNDILCFTDASSYDPKRVSWKKTVGPHTYILKALEDGYYWCTHKDSKNFYISESNRTLYVKVKESTENLYAVKIRHSHDYKLDIISVLMDNVWIQKIKEYVFYSTMYMKENYGQSEPFDNYTIMNFRNDHRDLKWPDHDIILKRKLKRLYLDARTVLVHVALHPEMKPVKPGRWEDIEIEYMKPAYYCDTSKDSKLALGESRPGPECKIYSCIGDYNEGVQLLMSLNDTCLLPTSTTLISSVKVTDVTATATTIPPSTAPTTRDLAQRDNSDSSSEEDHTPNHQGNNSTTETPENGYSTSTLNVTERLNVSSSTGYTVTDESGDTNITSTAAMLTSSEEWTTTKATETVYSVSTVTNEVLTWTPPPTGPPLTKPPPPIKPTTTTETPTTTTTPSPEEQLQQVIEDLETLLDNAEPIFIESVNETFDQVDSLLSDAKDLHIPGSLLNLLDELGGRIELNGTDESTTIRENIAFLVADAAQATPVRGLRIATRDTDQFTDNAFEIMRDVIDSTHLTSKENEVVVSLPDSVASSTRRISFVVFRNDRAFPTEHGLHVNSRVLSINVDNVTQFHSGEVIDIHLTPVIGEPERNQSRTCAYWHFFSNGSGIWSQDGCTFIRATQPGLLDTCRCDHLTHFAEILIPRTVFSERTEHVLEIISIVGLSLSIIGLLMVGVTAALFRSWRREYSNKVWLQLCVAIALMALCFLIVIFANFEPNGIACVLVGVALHYAVLASFCWMVVAAILSYRRLVTVFARDASHKLLKAAAFAWGIPCAIVGVLLSVAPNSYSNQFEEKSPSGAFCYPSGLAQWLSVYAPIVIMLLVNWTLFALIVRSVFFSRKIQRHGDTNEAIRTATVSCLLVFLFGLPWIFGLFSFNAVAAYFFTIFVTFQGFVLFLFFVIGNKKTRDLWLNKLKIKQTRKVPVTSSTFTNANPNSRAHQTLDSMEANASKPRSLNGSDNGKFS